MPILRQKVDGDFIIKGKLGGRFMTWQVSADGMAILSTSGIKPNDQVPSHVLRDLRARGFVYTYGGGIDQEPLTARNTRVTTVEQSLPLKLVEREDGWDLLLALPLMPQQFIAQLSDRSALASMLANCRLLVDEHVDVSATRLWPQESITAHEVVVEPHEHPYTVRPTAEWPEPLRQEILQWTIGSKGLTVKGSVFAGPERGGARLGEGEKLEPGGTYYICAIGSPGDRVGSGGPTGVALQSLGSVGKWEAWLMTLPDAISTALGNWCEAIGHPLAQPRWQLKLVSPPPDTYTANGTPVITARSTALIHVRPPNTNANNDKPLILVAEHNGVRLDMSPVRMTGNHWSSNLPSHYYVSLPAQLSGKYRLHARDSNASTLTFEVSHSEPVQTQSLEALQLRIIHHGQATTLAGHGMTTEPFACDIDALADDQFSAEVRCPVPINISWELDAGQRSRRENLSSEDAAALIESLAVTVRRERRTALIVIDAANFGRLRVQFSRRRSLSSSVPVEAKNLPLSVLVQLRWIATTSLASSAPRVHRIAIPTELRTALLPYKSYPEVTLVLRTGAVTMAGLASLRAVAAYLTQFDTSSSATIRTGL